jgi:hypothetical protein
VVNIKPFAQVISTRQRSPIITGDKTVRMLTPKKAHDYVLFRRAGKAPTSPVSAKFKCRD